MSSFLEKMRLNEDLKEKLYSASDKVLNYVNERPLWERFRSLDEFYFGRLKMKHYRDGDLSSTLILTVTMSKFRIHQRSN